VLDARAFRLFGLGKQQLVVLVHSGSRGLGESNLRTYYGVIEIDYTE
jgi:RNA-splicing ligase RtcB